MKPPNSRTQGQPNPQKIRLKVASGQLFPAANVFFVCWDWLHIGNRLQETQPNQNCPQNTLLKLVLCLPRGKAPVVYELGQPRCCQSGRLAMPRSILRIGMWFFGTVLIMHQQTNSMPDFFFSDRYDRYNDPKNTKAAIPCLKKLKQAGRHWICLHMRFEHEVKFRSKLAKLSGASP